MKQPRREFIEKAAGVSALLAAGAGRLNAQSQRSVGIPTPRAKTLMSLFNLNYPIFEAAHGVRVTCPELAIAVANAGAMGALAITGWPQEKARGTRPGACNAMAPRDRAATAANSRPAPTCRKPGSTGLRSRKRSVAGFRARRCRPGSMAPTQNARATASPSGRRRRKSPRRPCSAPARSRRWWIISWRKSSGDNIAPSSSG